MRKNFYKDHILDIKPYKGGKGRGDVAVDGVELIKLSSNENQLGSSPKALEAIRNSLTLLPEYPDRTDKRLRSKLASFYHYALDEQQFFCANSGMEILDIIARGFLDLGDEVIVSTPSFKPYTLFSVAQGAKVIDIPLKLPDFSLDVQGILGAITSRTRIVFLTSPNNPTGTFIKKSEFEKLLNQIPNHVLIIYDEVYYQYAVGNSEFTTAVKYVKNDHNIIAINSLSKAYGLAGLRLGYAYTTSPIASYLRKLFRPFLLNILSIEAGIAALNDHEFINQTVELVHTEKQYLYRELTSLNIEYWPSETNFIMFKSPIGDVEMEKAMVQHGVMVRPVGKFGADGSIRVTIGKHEQNKQFIQALKSILSGSVNK